MKSFVYAKSVDIRNQTMSDVNGAIQAMASNNIQSNNVVMVIRAKSVDFRSVAEDVVNGAIQAAAAHNLNSNNVVRIEVRKVK